MNDNIFREIDKETTDSVLTAKREIEMECYVQYNICTWSYRL